MSAGIPPPPINSPQGSYYWIEWYIQLTNILNGTGYPWTSLNFNGSNLTDIKTRNHNDLLNMQGGSGVGVNGLRYHMTGRGYVDITGVGTGLPSGWTVVRTSAGVFTVTHNLNLVAPNIGAIGTSATAGILVQSVNLTSANTAVFALTNPAGTATDGAFTFLIST